MGRNSIDRLKYIDKASDRSSSFSKNKMSLYDKALEFALMHGAKVYVVIISEKKKPHSFSTCADSGPVTICSDDTRDSRKGHTTAVDVMAVRTCLASVMLFFTRIGNQGRFYALWTAQRVALTIARTSNEGIVLVIWGLH